MIVNFQIGFRRGQEEGAMNASVDVPEGEVTVTELLPVLQRLTGRIVDGVVQGAGAQVSCRSGCAACCRQMVPVSVFEAEALTGWIRGLPAEQQEELRARFERALRKLGEHGLLERLKDIGDMPLDETAKLGLDYVQAWVDCPFLVNESCGIYPIRPLVCREYLVVSPPEFCATPWDKGIAGVEIPIQLSKALLRLGEKVEGVGKGWLPLVLLWEWMKIEERPGLGAKGVGQEVLGRVLGELQG